MSWELGGLIGQLGDALPFDVAVDDRSTADRPVLVMSEGDRSLLSVALALDDGCLSIAVGRDPDVQEGLDPDAAAVLLVVLAMRAGPPRLERVRLVGHDPIVRAQARRLGFTGTIRGWLTRPAWPRGETDDSAAPIGGEAPDLAAALAELVPGLQVTPRRGRGRVRRAAASAATGMTRVVELDVARPGDARPMRLVVSDPPDVLIEQVALAVDTALDVRTTFGSWGSCLRGLSFVRSQSGFRQGIYAGMAQSNLGLVQLNGDYLTPDGVRSLNRKRVRRGSARPPALVPSTFAPLDGVTAHECWHLIEGAYLAGHFGESIELRRDLGRYFGVASLELALYGGTDDAPPEQRIAFQRLRDEVSAYGTTNIREATAEMFKLWWCAPEPPTPVAAAFGEVLDRYFDVRRGDRR